MLISMANYSGGAMIGRGFLEASHESWVQNQENIIRGQILEDMFTPEAVDLSTKYPITVNTTQQWCEIADTLGLNENKRSEFLNTLARMYAESNGINMAYILEKVLEVYPIEPITLDDVTAALATLSGHDGDKKSIKSKTWKIVKELSQWTTQVKP